MPLPRYTSPLFRRLYEATTATRAPSLGRLNPPRRDLREISRSKQTKLIKKAMEDAEREYARWTKDSLVKRVKRLEQELQRAEPNNPALSAPSVLPALAPTLAPTLAPEAVAGAKTDAPTQPTGKKKKKRDKRKIDPNKYSTRYIALKLAYLGKNYNGFEYQSSASVSTIEEELWKALVKSCFIFPERPEEVDFGPWEYSKCGRTDRGVSAFGQVIGIRVRSNKPLPRDADADADDGAPEKGGKPAWDPVADEIPYCRVLNRLLPPDIRAVAWCGNLPADFSARFSCRERQYRYYFTQPAFAPWPSSIEGVRDGNKMKDGWLDIGAMRVAAKKFEGLHDFRNLCKVDPTKQITNFERRIFESDIAEVDDVHSTVSFLNGPEFRPDNIPSTPYPKVYYFHVRGSAFLWHQIRHMVAILFSVGQGLEPPSVVNDLLDVEKLPGKPNYTMADEVPLVLWDCVFPDLDNPELRGNHDLETSNGDMKDAIDWIWLGDDTPFNMHGSWGLADHLWQHWREKKMDELLANRLFDWASARANAASPRLALTPPQKASSSQRAFEGGNSARSAGRYVPVLKRQLAPSPKEMNDKWAQSKGFANAEEMTKTKNWRSALKAAKNGDGLSDKGEADGDDIDRVVETTNNGNQSAAGTASR